VKGGTGVAGPEDVEFSVVRQFRVFFHVSFSFRFLPEGGAERRNETGCVRREKQKGAEAGKLQ
jgi:hypothetical protein